MKEAQQFILSLRPLGLCAKQFLQGGFWLRLAAPGSSGSICGSYSPPVIPLPYFSAPSVPIRVYPCLSVVEFLGLPLCRAGFFAFLCGKKWETFRRSKENRKNRKNRKICFGPFSNSNLLPPNLFRPKVQTGILRIIRNFLRVGIWGGGDQGFSILILIARRRTMKINEATHLAWRRRMRSFCARGDIRAWTFVIPLATFCGLMLIFEHLGLLT